MKLREKSVFGISLIKLVLLSGIFSVFSLSLDQIAIQQESNIRELERMTIKSQNKFPNSKRLQ